MILSNYEFSLTKVVNNSTHIDKNDFFILLSMVEIYKCLKAIPKKNVNGNRSRTSSGPLIKERERPYVIYSTSCSFLNSLAVFLASVRYTGHNTAARE
jgi:hypothetical protein